MLLPARLERHNRQDRYHYLAVGLRVRPEREALPDKGILALDGVARVKAAMASGLLRAQSAKRRARS
jgi:hypothetical protein